MGVYPYQKKVKNKKTGEFIEKEFYMYAGKYTDPVTGERIQYKKRGFESSNKAKKAEEDYLFIARHGDVSNLKLNDLYKLYTDNRKNKIKQRSLVDIDYTYKLWIEPFWGEVKIMNINIRKITVWQHNLSKATYNKTITINNETTSISLNYSNEYLRTIQSMFKTILKFGARMGYKIDISALNFELIKNKNEMRKEMMFFEPDEFRKFISVVDDCQYNALFNILYWCGLRIGEALALQRQDINLKTFEININKTYDQKNRLFTAPKTQNSYRVALMPKQCLEAVKKWLDEARYFDDGPSHIVFGVNQPLDDNTIRRKKDKWSEQAGVKRIRIHDFRHSHVSLLIQLGFNSFDIAKRLGHTPEMVNNRYGHWFKNSQSKMIEKLNEI